MGDGLMGRAFGIADFSRPTYKLIKDEKHVISAN